MSISINFIRILFGVLSILFLTAYTTTTFPGGITIVNLTLGVFSGITVGFLLMASDYFLKKLSLRTLNVALIGLIIGYMLGSAIVAILQASLDIATLQVSKEALQLFKTIIYLVSCYIGTLITARASEEFYLSIPFVKFKATANKKKDILIDSSILLDSRIIDLAASGLLDNHLVLPRFTLKELYAQAENGDESVKAKARRSLEVCKKLETLPNLNMRFSDTDFPEIKDPVGKLVRLARLVDANVITADINRIQQSSIEGIVVINIHSLSNALKPLTQTGEQISIKIQRYGKEARQGVGYLEDGTMVVVNGGAEHIGETIKAQVLSVKHTSSGRMIFCNAAEEGLLSDLESEEALSCMENSHKSYFAMDSAKY
ncbi:MAG: hypothetical protein BGO14_05790 [Chlamydiales bacterium 38-26]|nr:TRAM domain-containing protein [Chlamydiales bacterium]OJV08408.1 MAG: hypothetical protein BGO14_05790 [Chlamydiales bacterium 38-26]